MVHLWDFSAIEEREGGKGTSLLAEIALARMFTLAVMIASVLLIAARATTRPPKRVRSISIKLYI